VTDPTVNFLPFISNDFESLILALGPISYLGPLEVFLYAFFCETVLRSPLYPRRLHAIPSPYAASPTVSIFVNRIATGPASSQF
jgi:hypothetical protein